MSAMSTAKEFWNAMARSVPVQYTTITRWSQILESYTDAQIDEARAAIVNDLKSHGVDTDVPSFMAAYADTIQNSLAFWGGHYLLRSTGNELFSLSISEDALQLVSMTKNVPLLRVASGFSLAAQTLSYDDASINLRLEFAFIDPTVGGDPEQLFDNSDRILQVVKGGTITIKGTVPVTASVTGKEGVYTAAGLESSSCGDPLSVWVGSYDCDYTDGSERFGTIEIGAGSNGAVQIAVGGQVIANALLRNNCVGFSPAAGRSVCARLICEPGGTRVIEGIVQSSDGTLRTLRGTASAPYSKAVRHRTSLEAAKGALPAAGICDVANDQEVDLGDPGTFVRPVLSALPVQYQDGSSGTIEIKPVRAQDVYRVPPGKLIVYHKADAAGEAIETDAALTVGWLATKPVQLLSMVQPDYYQLRLTIGGWYGLDNAGVAISLNQDDPDSPGYLAVKTTDVIQCPVDSIGARSSISNLTLATALLSVTNPIVVNTTLKYRLELMGKNTDPDNCSRTRDGFLPVELRFLTASGAEKMPARRTSLNMLLDVALPTAVKSPFKVTRPDTVPLVGQGRKFSAKVQATGGMAPYAITLVGETNPLNVQWVEDKSPAPGVSQWTVSGTVPVAAEAGSYLYTLCVQSDPNKTVSDAFVPLSVGVLEQGPPWGYREYIEPALKRASLNALYGKLLGSWSFFSWHSYLADYGPLGQYEIPARRRAAARMALVYLQPALAWLGQSTEEFVVSWYSFIENYGRVGGIVDKIMGNLESWRPFINDLRAKADDAWARFANSDNGLLTRAAAFATWFTIDEILHILNVESMATHEEIEIYMAARNNSLPKQ